MSSSRGTRDLASLGRELDAEEYSLLHAPSSSSVLSSGAPSARGESSVTPSTARVLSTRNLLLGGAESTATSRSKLVVISKGDLDTLCFGNVGGSSRFCIAEKAEGREDCGVAAHAKDKFNAEAGNIHPSGGMSKGRPTAKAEPHVNIEALNDTKANELITGVFTPNEATNALIAAAIPETPDYQECPGWMTRIKC